MTEKFEFIDAEYAAYQESDTTSVDREDVHMDGGIPLWVLRMAEHAGIGDTKRRGILALYVQKSFGDSDGTYGYRRVHADLADWGIPAGPELVRSLMRELGLEPCQPRPWRVSLTEGDGQEHDPDSWPGISLLTRPARKWSATSRTSRHGKAGFSGHGYRLPHEGGDRVGDGR